MRDKLVGLWLDHAPSWQRRGFAVYPLGQPFGLGFDVGASRECVSIEIHVLCFTYCAQWEAGF